MKTLLFKRFERYSEKILLLFGFVFTLLGSFIAYTLNFRFDGVLDAHIVPDILLEQPLVDNIINVFCLVLFLYATSKYLNVKTRGVDIIAVAIVSRIPLYLLSVININGLMGDATKVIIQFSTPGLSTQIPISSLLIVSLFGMIAVLLLVWYIALLYSGFKVASNAKGKKATILFIVSILLAELLSKVLIIHLN